MLRKIPIVLTLMVDEQDDGPPKFSLQVEAHYDKQHVIQVSKPAASAEAALAPLTGMLGE